MALVSKRFRADDYQFSHVENLFKNLLATIDLTLQLFCQKCIVQKINMKTDFYIIHPKIIRKIKPVLRLFLKAFPSNSHLVSKVIKCF